MRLYISGAISNDDEKIRDKNLARFHEMEKKLSSDVVEVINPASLEGECIEWEEYLARDLLIIHEQQPELYMMQGWKESKGARLEHEYAKRMGLKINYEQ